MVVAPVLMALLLLPFAGWAKGGSTSGFEKPVTVIGEAPAAGARLVTPQDFIEHAAEIQEDIHAVYFELRPYEGTASCLLCHKTEGQEMLNSAHFKWEGPVENIVGLKGQIHGKNDLLNNFCVAVPSNEGRCTQCHAGYGYASKDYDFSNPENVDCLVCHDQSGTYTKNPKTAGMPDGTVDLQLVASSIRAGSEPTRKACLFCHANAGGGDNVKHGDLSTDLVATTREYDVHMGTDGGNMSCVDCHAGNHDPKTGEVDHGIAGMPLHSVHEGVMRQCTDCHGNQQTIHADTPAFDALFVAGWHERLACQVCHIPSIARKISTKVEWYWEDAGKNISPVPIDTTTNPNRPTWDKKKGTFVWANNVRPTLRYFNGMWARKVIGVSDSYDEVPIPMATPQGSHEDAAAMIYPFKLMKGNQPVDTVNKTVLVPHLFGKGPGPNFFWGSFDWGLALAEGAAYAGQPYSGTYGFEDTTMLLTVNHEVAPAEQALGVGMIPDACMDCHATEHIDWSALGWTGDPLDGGSRVPGAAPARGMQPAD
jgi:octaheme c-type cytochrome (tetrathionate reductase family)